MLPDFRWHGFLNLYKMNNKTVILEIIARKPCKLDELVKIQVITVYCLDDAMYTGDMNST
jgi:hypothetical protein